MAEPGRKRPAAQTRAEYVARINRVLDHIETRLDEPLKLEQLARVAGFSRYHFHRVFAALVGETLSRFIQRLRLEKAASKLRHQPRATITEIALDVGFSSSSSFARAFKEQFGASASEWRDGRGDADSNLGTTNRNDGQAMGKLCEAVRVSPGQIDRETQTWFWRIEMNAENTIKARVDVVERDPMNIVYVRHVGPYAGDSTLFGGLIGKLMSWAGPRGLVGPGAQLLTVYHDDPDVTDADKLRISVGLSAPEGTGVDGEIGTMTVAGGQCAIARFEIRAEEYGDAWDAVFGGWLPDSGYQPDDRPCFELYHNDPGTHPEGKQIVDICVPVRPL